MEKVFPYALTVKYDVVHAAASIAKLAIHAAASIAKLAILAAQHVSRELAVALGQLFSLATMDQIHERQYYQLSFTILVHLTTVFQSY